MDQDLETPFADMLHAMEEFAFQQGTRDLSHLYEIGDFEAANRYEDLRHDITKAVIRYQIDTKREEKGR